ncbi:MAG TPA: monovalent cation/H(+) antiporter subunit G [Ilumatobacteraceae bacterium]|nr:monovalent cation/H(+) antiporter subunit G [Ilumatobacteraceae bacterium]
MIDVIAAVFLVSGTAFLMISALGLMRFPDFWTRAHAVAKAETLGLVLVFMGLIVLNRFGPGSLQLALIAAFSLLVNPTAIHALARSALRRGGPANEDAAHTNDELHSDDAEGSR